MAWTLTPLSLVVFASAVVAAGVGVGALRRRPEPLAVSLALLMFAVAAWALPHGVSLGFADVETVAFWHRLRYPGTVTAPVLFLVVALSYTGRDRWLNPWTYLLLSVVPILTVAAVWTNPLHGLFWESVAVASTGGASVFVPDYGPLYWVNVASLYLITLVGLLLFGAEIVRSGRLYRTQAGLVFVGALVPLATNVAMQAGLGPQPMVDLTTTALAVSGVIIALAVFHFDLLAVRPIARERLVEQLDDGVVVVGPNGRIRDFNPTADRVLGPLELDQPAAAVLPAVEADGGDIVVETDAGERRYRLRSNPLTDTASEPIGRIVYLNDVTEIAAREQRISVLNRILRHNIRNELNVVTGHLQMLEESEAANGHVATARQATRRVLDFAEKARLVERTLRDDHASTVVSAREVAEETVGAVQNRLPAARIHLAVADAEDWAVRVVDRDLFMVALEELVENGVEHGDCESPTVTVDLARDGSTVRLTVADDGPGIPASETEVLTADRETDLDHGSGLGLWLVNWTVSLSDGDLSFETPDDGGTVVTMTLPVADSTSDATLRA